MNGYIKLYRKLTQWGWYQDSVVKDLFLHLLLTASFKDFEWQGKTLKAGQLITGRKRLAEELNFTEQQIRTALKKLESTKEIAIFSTNKYSIVTVINWEDYQSFEEEATNEQPTSNQQATNNQPHINNIKNDKNVKNNIKENIIKENRHKYGEYKNVLLSDEEIEKLKAEFPNDYENRIERLSEYIASTGKKYKNHLATIRAWARKEKPVVEEEKYHSYYEY